MRKIFLILIVCSSFLGLRAQEDYTDDVDAEATETTASPIQARLDKISAKLQLTDEQIPEVEALLLEYFQRLKDDPPASPQDKSTRRRAVRTSVGKLLTPEQRQRIRQGKAKGGARKERRFNNFPDSLRGYYVVKRRYHGADRISRKPA